jgi:phenylpropionate dioxygenase-like ring-hydroxylating dioxygenase large terminal subunit
VKNAWYLAAWSDEITHELFARGGSPTSRWCSIAAEEGAAIALADRCPHRKFPLSAGSLDGDRRAVRLPRLPFRYRRYVRERSGSSARCRSRPTCAAIRWSNSSVRSGCYPGDAALADPAKIPHVPWTSEWWSTTGCSPLNARASLLIDNLLDLSHETYIHASGIGSPEVAETPIEVERDGDVLWVSRKMYGVACPPNYAKSTGLTSPIDRSQEIQFFAPEFYVLHVRSRRGRRHGPGLLSKVVYGITPETARTTHNFYGICRDVPRDPNQKPFSGQRITVREDTECLERARALARRR